MATNPFDQYDAPAKNPFDEFDDTPPKAGALRQISDVGVAGLQGVVGGAKSIADFAGANNKVSSLLSTANDGLQSVLSEPRRAEIATRQRAVEAADASGSTIDSITSRLGGFAEAPVSTIAQGLGSALPTIAAVALPPTRSAAARQVIGAGVGAAQGAGSVKGGIYDSVKQAKIDAGATPAEADAAAEEAQRFNGANAEQIALGGALGAVAASSGAERLVDGLVHGVTKAPKNFLPRVAAGAAAEALPEGAQGSQQQLAQNLALTNSGTPTDPMKGVIGAGVLDAAVSAPIGAGFAAPRPRDTAAAQPVTEVPPAADPVPGASTPPPVAPVLDTPPPAAAPAPGDPLRAAKLPEAGPLSRGINTLIEGEAQAADAGTPVQTPVTGALAGVPAEDAAPKIPVGEATEVDPIPAGEATELPADQVQPAAGPTFDPATGEISQPQRATFPTREAVDEYLRQARLQQGGERAKAAPVELPDGTFSFLRPNEPGYDEALTESKQTVLQRKRAAAAKVKAEAEQAKPPSVLQQRRAEAAATRDAAGAQADAAAPPVAPAEKPVSVIQQRRAAAAATRERADAAPVAPAVKAPNVLQQRRAAAAAAKTATAPEPVAPVTKPPTVLQQRRAAALAAKQNAGAPAADTGALGSAPSVATPPTAPAPTADDTNQPRRVSTEAQAPADQAQPPARGDGAARVAEPAVAGGAPVQAAGVAAKPPSVLQQKRVAALAAKKKEAPAGQSGKPVEPGSLQPFAGATSARADTASVATAPAASAKNGGETLSLGDKPTKTDTGGYEPAPQAQRTYAADFQRRIQKRYPAAIFDAVAAPVGSGGRGAAAGGTGRAGEGVSSESLAATAAVGKRLFGHEVVFVKFRGDALFNGAMSDAIPGVVFVNVESERPHMAVLGHELLHQLRASNQGAYSQLSERLAKITKGENRYIAGLAARYAAKGASTENVRFTEELHADIVGDFFMDQQFWEDMARDKPGLFRRVAAAIVKFLDRTLAKMTGPKPFGTDEFVTDIKAARAAVVDAMRQFSSERVAATRRETDGINLSIAGGVTTAANKIADRFNAGEAIVGRTNRKYTDAQLASMRNVGFAVKPPTLQERIAALWQDAGKKLAQGIVDQFAPVSSIDKKAYNLLRLSKGASGAFQVLLEGGKLRLSDGVYDFEKSGRGGVVQKLLKPLQGEHHDFLRWVAANRAERLMGAGKENLFSPDDIKAIKSLSDGMTAFDYTIQNGPQKGAVTRNRKLIYADALQVFNGFHTNVLDMAEASGLIDGEARKMWENDFYVPFYRVEDDGSIAGASIKSGVVRQQAFKSLTGRTGKLNADLLDNTLMNWAHLLDASAKNRAAKATIEAAERMGAATTVDGPSGKGTVWFREGGEKRYAMVADPYLLTAITSLEYAGMNSPIMKAMSLFKHTLTTGVTASPFFKIRNLIRDSVQVIGTSKITANPFANVAAGWKLTSKESDTYFRLLAGGGTIHFGTMMEGSEAKRVQALVESGVDASTILDSEKKVQAFYRKLIQPGIRAYTELGDRGEAINRAALYDQLIKQGLSHADASLQARDLMDFSMQGSFTTIRFLTQVVPFFNARIQGLYKLGRGAKEDPARFSAVIGAASLLSLGLLAAYGDDDDWKKREDWDRNNYWWFKFGGTAFRIPKPFEIGAIATLAERGFELAFEKEMTTKRFREQVMTLLGDNLSMNPVPQMVKPIIDVYSNKDSFSGRPIESLGMEKLQSEYRFNGSTSMAARGVSTAANAVTGLVGKEALSPVQIDHMLRGYFGWLGTFVVAAGDQLARPATGQKDGATPDYMKKLTGGIASDLRDQPSRYVSQMYEQAKEIEQAYGTMKMLRSQGKLEEAADFAMENKDSIDMYKRVEYVKRAVSKINSAIRQVEQSDRSSDEKREMIRVFQRQRDMTARTLLPA